jgi:hypothetical protein
LYGEVIACRALRKKNANCAAFFATGKTASPGRRVDPSAVPQADLIVR